VGGFLKQFYCPNIKIDSAYTQCKLNLIEVEVAVEVEVGCK
jgi:hypothetical protein